MVTNDLRLQLTDYRELLSTVWSLATVHYRFAGEQYDHAPRSTGQCGVTSAWLAVVLAGRHGIRATYCYGDVRSTTGLEVLVDHCWLEVGEESDSKRLIVDLTCDQVNHFKDQQVLCESYEDLADRWAVDYRCKARMTPEQLDGDPVQDRLDELVKAVGAARSPVISERWARLF
jgi:hypothetical protein